MCGFRHSWKERTQKALLGPIKSSPSDRHDLVRQSTLPRSSPVIHEIQDSGPSGPGCSSWKRSTMSKCWYSGCAECWGGESTLMFCQVLILHLICRFAVCRPYSSKYGATLSVPVFVTSPQKPLARNPPGSTCGTLVGRRGAAAVQPPTWMPSG